MTLKENVIYQVHNFAAKGKFCDRVHNIDFQNTQTSQYCSRDPSMLQLTLLLIVFILNFLLLSFLVFFFKHNILIQRVFVFDLLQIGAEWFIVLNLLILEEGFPQTVCPYLLSTAAILTLTNSSSVF